MRIERRGLLAGLGALGAAASLTRAKRTAAATPVKLTLPLAAARHLSFAFVARRLGYFAKRGLDVTIDRGFGSTQVCVPVDQRQYDFGLLDLAVMAGCARAWI
jgi:ABC-type nitrate/sulfonate/bicarbonate transport system substrate-binding protein